MKVSEERLAEYNGTMNDWIAKQGLIFQLTHGGTGLGGKPPLIGSLIRFLISILLVVLLSAAVYAGFLFWKATGDDLPKQLNRDLSQFLGVEEITAVGFERDLGSGSYKELEVEGTEDTFYNQISTRGVEFSMEPTSGLFGEWDAQTIKISELKISLKAGEADDERARTSWQSLFYASPSFRYSKLAVTRATLTWGYSTPATWGSITDSSLIATRTPEGWKLDFRGGAFSQGIFRNFGIDTLSVELTEEGGLKVTEAKLTYDEGTLQWTGEMLSGGSRPTFAFEGQLNAIPVSAFLPKGILSLVNGSFSGDFSASGSTNDADGISFQLTGRPDGSEGIVLTKELAILGMLSHLDFKRSYRKVSFNRGSFKLETKGSVLDFSEINLSSQDPDTSETFAQLRGNFEARPTTREELEKEVFSLDDNSSNPSQTIGAEVSNERSLEEQALFANSVLRKHQSLQFSNPPQELYYFTKDAKGDELIKKRLDLTPRRTFRFPFIVKGQLDLAVPASAFNNAPPLPGISAHEDNPDLKWIQIDLQDMIQASTKKLSIQWEEALNEAAEAE